MQLDKTSIVIRERGLFELLDLTLCVLRGYGGSLLACWFVGCAPFALLNLWLFREHWHPETFGDGWMNTYLWHSLMLVMWELPLATAPMTMYLGQSLFLEQPTPGGIVRSLLSRWGQIVFFSIFLRGMYLAWPTLAFISDGEPGMIGLASVIAVLGLGFTFFFWPYANEVLLLERNPLFARRGEVNTWRRVLALHGHATGDVFGRSMICMFIAGVLGMSLWLAAIDLHQKVMLEQEVLPAVNAAYFQITIWFVAGFFTVVRFLSYLDLRIRTEGWEIELLLRAEGAKIARQVA